MIRCDRDNTPPLTLPGVILSFHSSTSDSLADVAQLAEQLICNQQVRGSIPLVSSGCTGEGRVPAAVPLAQLVAYHYSTCLSFFGNSERRPRKCFGSKELGGHDSLR